MRTRFQRGISVLLAAVMFTVWTAPPAVCHVHARGDHSHRHDHRHAHHGHSHEGEEHHTSRDHTHKDGAQLVTEAVAHVHASFLGFDVTWPLPPSKKDGTAGHEPSESMLTACRSAEWAIPGRNVINVWDFMLVPVDQLGCGNLAADQHQHFAGSTVTASLPLCDSARLERTGVFNI